MASDGIWIVPARGGAPRQVTTFGSAPAWSPDGRRLAFQSLRVTDISPQEGTPGAGSTIWLVDAAGGAPRPLTQPGHPFGAHFVPIWSPDGTRVYFPLGERYGSPFGPQSIWWADVASGKSEMVVSSNQLTRYLSLSAAGDEILFGARDTGLPWRLRIDPASGRALGDPEPVGLAGTGPGARHLMVSADGRRHLWTSMNLTTNIWSIDVDPGTGRSRSEAVALTDDAGARATLPAVATDGRVAFTRSTPGKRPDVFVLVPGAVPRQVTFDPGRVVSSTWTADGREVVVMEAGTGYSLRAVDPETGRDRLLFGPLDRLWPPGATVIGGHSFLPASGRFAIGLVKSGLANVWIGLGDGRGPGPLRQLTFEKEAGSYPSLSEDGRWVAYQCAEGGATNVCVVPAEGGTRLQLTNDQDQNWVSGWAPDHDRIVFASRKGAVWNIALVSRTTRATQTVTSFTRAAQYVRYPVWAPARDRIVFERGEITGRIWSVEIPAGK